VHIPERVRVRVSVLIYVKSFVNFAKTVTVYGEPAIKLVSVDEVTEIVTIPVVVSTLLAGDIVTKEARAAVTSVFAEFFT
jgi:hypothetical protein